MANPFMPKLYVSVDSMLFGKHCRFHLMRIEDEHLTFSLTVSDNSVFFFDEAPSVIEVNLHAMFHILADVD